MFKNGRESGQVALVVILISAITLMLGLSASRRSTIDVSIGHDEELSAKAFTAAESGLEYVLSELAADGSLESSYTWPSSGDNPAGTSAEVDLSEIGGGTSFYTEDTYAPGEVVYFWLRNPANYGDNYIEENIDICWQAVDTNPAVAVHLFYVDAGDSYGVTRYAVDGDGGRRGLNGFSNPASSPATGCDAGFTGTRVNVLFYGQPVLMALMPLYDFSRWGMVSVGGGLLPAQGYRITSTGIAANVKRALQMDYMWSVPPFYFVDGVFSGGSIN